MHSRPDHPASHHPALSVLVSTDPVLRDTTAASLALTSPGAVVVRHDLLPDDGALRRVVVDATGVIEDVTVELEHACVSCSVREDAVPTLARLAWTGRWTDLVLALPVTAEPLPVGRALAAHTDAGEVLEDLRFTATVAVVDLDRVEADLLGDDLVDERDLALTPDDERPLGEALAAQLEQVDVVVTTGDDPTGAGLVDRLRARDSRRIDGLHELDVTELAACRHDSVAAEGRAHPLGARNPHRSSSDPADRSWSLLLKSRRPFHPERLLEQIEHLGTGPVRSRGVFHVPDRPDSVCLWDGAGGALCVADLGTWQEVAGNRPPVTRILVVGAGEPDEARSTRDRILDAFGEALATGAEVDDGGLRWLGREDVLEPWLGARTA
ncbi:G3E family GTPase [Isoptericola sp. CG 20/1183]|uniref:G3E family GTPase n=1 Tax=Isoptericola halotolerans TaxID=300560 RepID=A0ABX5EL71_9MICO|nr:MULTISPECIES: GTP-binding protein [Isoptericola]PRZ02892.1 G3E family GTPase [Isoptericola sp. CG 20/1183]PRZ09889.1 G3E family GTPase [Isoptericola halotolerans]